VIYWSTQEPLSEMLKLYLTAYSASYRWENISSFSGTEVSWGPPLEKSRHYIPQKPSTICLELLEGVPRVSRSTLWPQLLTIHLPETADPTRNLALSTPLSSLPGLLIYRNEGISCHLITLRGQKQTAIPCTMQDKLRGRSANGSAT